MCGLSAIVDFGGGVDLPATLLAMHDRIPHRGPDGEGFCVVDGEWRCRTARSAGELRSLAVPAARIGLGFRWLQIQDRSEAAAQPMASHDGSIHLLFNGEIYNFGDLRRELEACGRRFLSVSDTEVVLAAYERWGSAMFTRLEGMWAIVVLDLRERKLVLSRDRLGIKPLFYCVSGSRLAVASEVKQLLAAGVPAKANASAVARFIRGRRPEPPEQTYFNAIHAQPPATCAEVDLRAGAPGLEFRAYWSLPEGPQAGCLPEACDRLDGLLARSVEEHLVGPVPMGILVSGGLDSSLVAALSRPAFARRGEAGAGFSMVLGPEERRLDETPHIDKVVAASGLRGFRVQLEPAWLKANMGHLSRAQEEPVAGIAVAGQYLAYELAASQGARVVLDGQGADEIFAGYPRHQVAWLLETLRRGALGEFSSELAALLFRDRRLLRDAARGWVSRRLPSAKGRPGDIGFIRAEPAGDAVPPRSLEAMLRKDVLVGNLRSVLALTDRNAMAHSIEARVPYLDRRIVEFAFALPARYKIGGGQRKRILRAVGARHLPAGIATRGDRIGFGAPTREWLLKHFVTELRSLPAGPAYRDSAAIDRDGMRRFIEDFLRGGHGDAAAVWRLYAVDQWARAYAVAGL